MPSDVPRPIVVFVAPFFLPTTLSFVEAVAGLPGVRLGLIGQNPSAQLPPHLKRTVEAFHQVADALDPQQIADATRALAKKMGGPVHRLLGTLEQLQVPLGEVRDLLRIDGMGAETARNFRDKARMKTVLRQAGLPCARHCLAAGADEARRFAAEVGYPLVVKPPEGAGAKATFRVDDGAALEVALDATRPIPGREVLVEEFVVGDEFSFETLSVGGRAAWHSVTHYHPTPLEVLRNPWIQWCLLLPREIDHPRYAEIRRAGTAALTALGMGTGLTHLEWFRRRDGSVAISEVGARPPGAQITTLVSYAHDVNFKRVWARLMIFDQLDMPPRRYATGAAFLRGQGRGRVQRIRGLGQAQKELGQLVVETHLPQAGQPQASGYEGEGYVILRHPETEVVERALRRLINLVRVEMG